MDTEWRELDLTAHDVCGAPYGGAVAVVRQPLRGSTTLMPLGGGDTGTARLTIFNSAGCKIQELSLARDDPSGRRSLAGADQRIVGLGWTDREELLLVSEDGGARLFDVRGTLIGTFPMLPPAGLGDGADGIAVREIHVWGDGVLVLASSMSMYVASRAGGREGRGAHAHSRAAAMVPRADLPATTSPPPPPPPPPEPRSPLPPRRWTVEVPAIWGSRARPSGACTAWTRGSAKCALRLRWPCCLLGSRARVSSRRFLAPRSRCARAPFAALPPPPLARSSAPSPRTVRAHPCLSTHSYIRVSSATVALFPDIAALSSHPCPPCVCTERGGRRSKRPRRPASTGTTRAPNCPARR